MTLGDVKAAMYGRTATLFMQTYPQLEKSTLSRSFYFKWKLFIEIIQVGKIFMEII